MLLVVKTVSPTICLVMEDLCFIRERIRVAREQRLIKHSWAFGQIGNFIEYKAHERGAKVVYVDLSTSDVKSPIAADSDSPKSPA